MVANTLAEERRSHGFSGNIICRSVESKRDVLQVFAEVREKGDLIDEFHFVGHSGMYGPMFGTVSFPEQFSPYEWETMDIPFSAGASAYFHCCRSARWFAPFFARTFNIKAHGFFWYTTFSKSPKRFKYAGTETSKGPLFTIGCKGRKSHGITASILKFASLMPAEVMRVFEPSQVSGEDTYNRVADLYDRAFTDIRVRRDEWNWLNEHLPAGNIDLLDIGCGNGALLHALSDRLNTGHGVDESAAILEKARIRNIDDKKLSFTQINGPKLPFSSGSFDVVVSLMSFRYLDWDPLLAEIKRVVRPGGKLLIIDMVTVPVKTGEYPRLIKDKLRTIKELRADRRFNSALNELVTHPDWKKMLEYNPIRSEHEMKWYLESRFPGQKVEILNMAWNSRIVAFDSGPVENGIEAKLSYP